MQMFTCPKAHSLPHTVVVFIVCSEDVSVGGKEGPLVQLGPPTPSSTIAETLTGLGLQIRFYQGFLVKNISEKNHGSAPPIFGKLWCPCMPQSVLDSVPRDLRPGFWPHLSLRNECERYEISKRVCTYILHLELTKEILRTGCTSGLLRQIRAVCMKMVRVGGRR